MRIRGWQIEGFGVFCDYRVEDLPSGLVLVHGPNEAGKSTLLAFLRGVLFGFPDRRGGESLYPPLRGGRHGGAILLEGEEGIYRIARQSGRRGALSIVTPDGSEGQDDDLHRLLGGADRQLFKSVFAFSLQDLAAIDTLSSDEVRARIFSAGIAGAGRSAREVIDGLEAEAAGLLGPRTGRIRDLVKEAQSLSDRIGVAVGRAAAYGDALQQETGADAEVSRLRGELGAAEHRVRRAVALLDAWPTESERQQAAQALAALPSIDSFPADPEERLAATLGKVDARKSLTQEAERSLQQLREQRQRIETDERLVGIAGAAEDRWADSAVQRERLQRAAELQAEVRRHDERVAEVLRDLGPAWTEARLEAFDTSLPAAEEVRDWQETLAATKRAAEAAAAALVSLERRTAGVEETLGRIAVELDRSGDSLTEDDARATLGRLAAVAEAMTELGIPVTGAIVDVGSLERPVIALASARQESARLATIAAQAKARLDAITPDQTLVGTHEKVGDMARRIEVERQRLRDIDNLEATQRERREAIDRGVRELGVGWTEERVRAIPTDFSQMQQVREFAVQLALDREKVGNTERELDHVGKGRSGREKDFLRMQEQLAAPEPTSTETLEKQSRSFRRLRAKLAELAQLEADRRAEERASEDAAGEQPATLGAGRIRQAPGFAVVIAVLLSLLSLWRALSQDIRGASLLALACVLTAAFAFVVRTLTVRARKGSGAGQRDHQEARRRLADLNRRLSESRDAVAQDARGLGLSELPTLDQIEDRQDAWATEKDARRRRDELSADAGRLEHDLESWRDSELRRTADRDAAVQRAAQTLHTWEAWLAGKGLPQGMAPDGVRDLLQQVRSLQERMAEREAAADRLDTERQAWRLWRTNALALLTDASGTPSTDVSSGDLFDRILNLQRQCAEQVAIVRERSSMEGEVADWSTKLADAQRQVLAARREAISAIRVSHGRARTRWLGSSADRDRRNGELKASVAKGDSTSRAWEAWQADRGIGRQMSPDGVLDFFGTVRRGREALERRTQFRGELENLGAAVERWDREAAHLLSVAGLPVPDAAPHVLMDGVREVARRCAADAEARREIRRLDGDIEAAVATLDRVQQELCESEGMLSALFEEAGVASEQGFRERLSHYRERKELKRRLVELETRLVALLGRGDEAAQLRRELDTGRLDEWATERSHWEAGVDSLRGEHEAAIRRHQDLSNVRCRLEESADVAELELQLQAVRDELAAAVRRRRVTSLAAALVAETLAEFERTRQPAVLANASEAFLRVTDGRYQRIVQTQGEEGVVVLDRLGARHAVGDLSRGTKEQLYLSMRLGLAREFAQRSVPLPLVMDDVLVNFDEDRARRMALELMEFARTQQVLLFTCHTSVRSMLLELAPDMCVIDLPVQDLAGGEDMPAWGNTLRPTERLGPAPRSDLLEGVLASLVDGPLPLPELVDRLQSTADHVRRVLVELRERGLVVMTGQKRGARYALSEPTEA